MQRDIVWQRIDGLGLEHLRLTSDGEGLLADGMLLAVEEGKPLRGAYSIRCDRDWRVREVEVRMAIGAGTQGRSLSLRVAGDGRWQTEVAPEQWEVALALEGCCDIDIYPSPFTNTLAIRRLQLATELPVDAEGLVVEYPDWFRRVLP